MDPLENSPHSEGEPLLWFAVCTPVLGAVKLWDRQREMSESQNTPFARISNPGPPLSETSPIKGEGAILQRQKLQGSPCIEVM